MQFCNDGFKINCPFEAEDKKKSGVKSKSLRHGSFFNSVAFHAVPRLLRFPNS